MTDQTQITLTAPRSVNMALIVGPGDFTDNGHFFVVTGIDGDGNLRINDPYSAERSNRAWDVDTVLGQTKALWAYRLA